MEVVEGVTWTNSYYQLHHVQPDYKVVQIHVAVEETTSNVHLCKKKGSVLLAVFQLLIYWVQNIRSARIIFYPCSDWTRGNGHKLEHRQFRMNVRKNFITVWVTEHWDRLPREVVESSSLEIFKIHLDAFLLSLLQRTAGGLDLMISRVPFQPLWFWFCDSMIPLLLLFLWKVNLLFKHEVFYFFN